MREAVGRLAGGRFSPGAFGVCLKVPAITFAFLGVIAIITKRFINAGADVARASISDTIGLAIAAIPITAAIAIGVSLALAAPVVTSTAINPRDRSTMIALRALIGIGPTNSELEQLPDARAQGRYRRCRVRSVAPAEPELLRCVPLRQEQSKLIRDRRAILHQRRQALLRDLIDDDESESLDAAELTSFRQKTAFAETVAGR